MAVHKSRFAAFAGLVALALSTNAPALAGEESPAQLFTDGTLTGEARYRFEYVDQDGPAPIARDAKASTVRANIGYKTGKFYDIQAYVEGQLVENIGGKRFNDTVNGKTVYPVVADPDNAELNQAWIDWSGIPDTAIRGGRQGINLGNQRFIGTVGWRQNDQTFDGVMVTNTSIDKTNFKYGYIWNVNRIFGDDHPLGDLESEVHFVNAGVDWADWFKLAGYGYWFDFDRLPGGSTRTFGIQVQGDVPLGEGWFLPYLAEWARQSDYENNPASYSENYIHLSPGIAGHGLALTAGYEKLGGDGAAAFQTPLATLHKFNGWTDKFLVTPATGLEDFYGTVSYTVSGVHDWIDGTKFLVAHHEFRGDTTGDYGSETGFLIGKTFPFAEDGPLDSINITLKYADYNAEDAPFTDTQKLWLQLTSKLSAP